MIAHAIQATAGIGIGTFLGTLLVLFVMKRAGRDVQLFFDSVFMTAVAVGMAAWTAASLMQFVV